MEAHITQTSVDEAVLECRSDTTVGTQTGTETIIGQVTATAGTSHVRSTGHAGVHGRPRVEGTATEHFSFTSNGRRVTQTSTIVEPEPSSDRTAQPWGLRASTP